MREDLTRERCVQNAHVNGERLYRTGDLARYTAEGELEYLGRMDDQVKIRGYRIELGEIEQQLTRLEGDSEGVVLARRDGEGGKRLVAYIVSLGYGEGEIKSELIDRYRKELSERLSEYMVPGEFVLLERMPLTVNGKVDRKALPQPETARAESAEYAAPANEVEEALCAVWQEVLKRERVGVKDNFFSPGGDSILSVPVVSMLKARGIALSIRDIFQYQTIEQLAVQAKVQGEDSVQEEQKLEPFALLTQEERAELGEGYEDAYPMSTLQAGMVFHTQLEQFSGIYHDIVTDHVKCEWDKGEVAEALAACVKEQPILRPGFRLQGARPLQQVHAVTELPLEVEDLRDMTSEGQRAHMAHWQEKRRRHVFNWEKGPLFHFHIFLRTTESFEFVLSFHHAVLDGWSRAAFTTMLYNRYQRLLSGRQADPVTVNWIYRDFIAQEQRVLENPAASAHFKAMLEDAPVEQLPQRKSSRGERVQSQIAVSAFNGLSGRLIELAKELGVPVQAVLQSGHFKVLSLLSGQNRAVTCVTHNGRPEELGAERSLGLFLNSVPVALELEPVAWRQMIRQVAEGGARSIEYRGYPLARIQQDTGMELSEVTFNYIHFHVYREMTQTASSQFEVLDSSGYEQTNFDLEVQVARGLNDDTMWLTLVYQARVWREEFMARPGALIDPGFKDVLCGPEGPVDVLSPLPSIGGN